MNKKTGQYFVGFNADHSAKWGDKSEATSWISRLHAQTQALALSMNLSTVQKKPVFMEQNHVPM